MRSSHKIMAKSKGAQYAMDLKRRRKDFVIGLKKQNKCSNCGDDRWYILDYHHKNSNLKKYEIGDMCRRGFSEKSILTEIKKCDILCSNCHREIHFLQVDKCSSQITDEIAIWIIGP